MIIIKKDFDELSKFLDNFTSIINILFVIYGIRPAFWYDIWDLDKTKLNKLLNFLEKKTNIKYKFDNGNNYLKGNQVIEEGPLIYNTSKLNNQLLQIIENDNLKVTYDLPVFGKILGYNCHEDIFNIDKTISVDIFIYFFDDNNIKYPIYGFMCYSKDKFKNINDNLSKLIKKMDNFVKKINKKYKVQKMLILPKHKSKKKKSVKKSKKKSKKIKNT